MSDTYIDRPPSHLVICDDLGLRIVSYLNESVKTNLDRSEWLPRDIVGRDGKTLIVHRDADSHYAFPGWDVEHDGMFGGRRQGILPALTWVKRAMDVRAGKARDFLGV